MQIEKRKLEELLPYPNNAKIHSEDQIKKIAASIKEFGFNNPILIDGTNGIIAGHGRLLAAQLLEHEEVPTIELSHLTEQQKRAYIIADNRLSEVGTSWDMELVELELSDIDEFDLSLTGFDQSIFDEPEIDDIGQVDEMYQIIITLESSVEQEELLERLMREGISCKALIL